MATRSKTLKTFETGRGYDRVNWDAVELPELKRRRTGADCVPRGKCCRRRSSRRWRIITARAGVLPWRIRKKQITLRLDEDVIAKFSREAAQGLARAHERGTAQGCRPLKATVSDLVLTPPRCQSRPGSPADSHPLHQPLRSPTNTPLAAKKRPHLLPDSREKPASTGFLRRGRLSPWQDGSRRS